MSNLEARLPKQDGGNKKAPATQSVKTDKFANSPYNVGGSQPKFVKSSPASKPASKAPAIKKSSTNLSESQQSCLEKSQKAIASVKKNDIVEIKAFKSPAPLIVQTLSVVRSVLTGEKVSKIEWIDCQKMMAELDFLKQLKNRTLLKRAPK